MNDSRISFDNFGELQVFAQSFGIPESFGKRIEEMSNREKGKLNSDSAWLISLECQIDLHRVQDSKRVLSHVSRFMSRVYADFKSFHSDYNSLCLIDGIRVTELAAFKLRNGSSTIVFLDEPSPAKTLSYQLMKWTGSSYNSVDFHNWGQPDVLTAQGLIVHRKTRQVFYVPPVRVDELADICDSPI